jgi:oligopeptide transport system substrate-binding protein
MRTRIVLLVVTIISLLTCAGCKRSFPKDANEMVLHHVLNSKIKGFDPVLIQDEYSLNVSSQIFETFYQYHYLKRPYQLVPLLAESMPEFSDGGLTCTVRIKKGVPFQDDACFPKGKGRELKANDFVYGIKRMADIKTLSPNWAVIENKIVGLDEFREYTKTCKSAADVNYSREIEGLQVPDDYTVVIKLKRPWPQLVDNLMADVRNAPMAKEAVDYYGKDIIAHPVGTGPFMLKDWQRASYIELVRNPNFRGETYPTEGEPGDKEAGLLDDAGKKMPFADRVIWTIIEESQPSWLLFMQGKLDARAIPKDNWSEAMTADNELAPKMKQLNIRLFTFKDPSTFYLGFNMLDPVLGKNKPLRQAINYAIDRKTFIKLFFNNTFDIAYGDIPPVLASYNPEVEKMGYADYDPNKSKKLLIEAENIQGGKIPPLKIAMQGTDTFYRQFGSFIQRQLEAIGLNIEMEYMDWPTFQARTNKRDVQMFAGGGGCGIPDAQDSLSEFYSKFWAPGVNHFNYKNPEFDKLYEQTEVMMDSPERTKLYQKMELIVLEDCPAAFLDHRVGYVLVHDWYKNYHPHIFGYGLSKYQRVDMKKRAEYPELVKKLKD